ncbi:transglutaminase-like domain-containing protein [Desulfobacterota bacterium M19]
MKINYSDIEDAFMFVSSGYPCEHTAYISRYTGVIYYHSEYGDFDELPEDIDDPQYISIPHKTELNLGKRLVLKFAYKYLGDKADEVESFFRRKGAYAKFKSLLERLGKLELWYKYEESAQRKLLTEWLEDNNIKIASTPESKTHSPELHSLFGNNEKQKYLENTNIINWQHPTIIECSKKIFSECNSEQGYISQAFEYVRDKIKHSWDFQKNPVTCTASEVLEFKTGYCYAKSHLLAALLRARNIPAGFCYQRLSFNDNGAPYCLHGLNAVYLPQYGWYRIDARGNKKGVNAQFSPPNECLAFTPVDKLERDLPEIWSAPLPVVVEALEQYKNIKELHENLPDIQVVT